MADPQEVERARKSVESHGWIVSESFLKGRYYVTPPRHGESQGMVFPGVVDEERLIELARQLGRPSGEGSADA